MIISFLLIAAFLIGSVPSGFLVGKLRGVDIREHGSGNVGATNAGRVMGKRAGFITLGCDVIKGIVALWLASFAPQDALLAGTTTRDLSAILGLTALVGHCYSPFLKFRGGKGVATGAGVFLMLAPVETSIALGIFAVLLKWKGYVSLSSCIAAASVPLLLWIGPVSEPVVAGAATAAAALIIYRHKANIERLRAGKEPKAGK